MKPEESATTGADLLVKALIDEEVEVVFGYPGGAVLPIYDSLFKQNRLRHIVDSNMLAPPPSMSTKPVGACWRPSLAWRRPPRP